MLNAERLAQKVEEIRRRRSAPPAQMVSLTLAVPLLRTASEESDPELQDLWARLMAAAMDPTRNKLVRMEFIETIKQMNPIDAVVFNLMEGKPTGSNVRKNISARLNRSMDTIQVSLERLEQLGCMDITDNVGGFHLKAYGRELAKALSDQSVALPLAAVVPAKFLSRKKFNGISILGSLPALFYASTFLPYLRLVSVFPPQ